MEEKNKVLGYLLRMIRKQYSISSKQLSSELFISQSTLSKIENQSQIAPIELFKDAFSILQEDNSEILFDLSFDLQSVMSPIFKTLPA
ncbi:helix-turn-helix domain-containing protein [Ileibacterium valens]|uniref:HTH cro/C1-type domain-containing protein n=1 Tax=Ileibacterium valens TaxID=1862668 RepID=A0A1U7NIL3_9FIRM|nr:helix-turn-helix transcriptional regulator [Ileibacterium valens]OLU38971.1 hypothetical protein BO224_08030 [Erysipelotrichaceae bacterium NYU-BL-E8]OLU40894.1 hypothetical protein BM735_04940 [Erysipelotrichaceae bacterium NYU-BL-F16]OLU42436.1 hypothetical protein BO222_01590 [Ileibacterium valens]